MSIYNEAGSQKITAQGMLSPSDTAIRLYMVNMYVSSTATPAAACMVFGDAKGTAVTTSVTSQIGSATAYLTVYYDQDKPVGNGVWESGEGLLFPRGLFIQTATDFSYATLIYSTEYRTK